MNISLENDLKAFVREKVRSGEFPSEEAVVEAALRRLQDQEAAALEGLIDREFVALCDREGDDGVTLDIDHFVCAGQRLCDVAVLEGLAIITP